MKSSSALLTLTRPAKNDVRSLLLHKQMMSSLPTRFEHYQPRTPKLLVVAIVDLVEPMRKAYRVDTEYKASAES